MKTLYKTFRLPAVLTVMVLILGSFMNVSAFESPTMKEDIDVKHEEMMEIENWMTSLSEWHSELNVQIETEIKIEDWMLTSSEQNWESAITVEKEEEIEVETWMSNLSRW